MSRPPDSRSSVSAILATIGGCRYGRPSTRVATVIRDVLAAIQDSIVHVSYVGSSPHGWSAVETKPKPSSSASRASATGSAPGAAEAGTLSPNSTFVIVITFRDVDGESGNEHMGERADAGRVQERPDAHGAAEQPAHSQHGGLDQGAHPADGPAPAGQAGHQPVARARAEPGADVQPGRDAVGEDPGGQEGRPDGQRPWLGQHWQHRIDHQPDHDHVADRADTGALP